MGVVIAVDAMGGDTAPLSVVEGVRAAVESSELSVLLVGNEAELRPLVGDHPRITLRHAPSVVPQDAEPADAVRGNDGASIVVAARAVKAGEAHALVSAGHSGATLAAAALIIGRAPGVIRPGLAAVLPGAERPTVLIDAGANMDTTPQQLHQFAHLGSSFAGNVLLKTCEGTAREAFRRVRAEATGLRAQLGGVLLRPALRRVRDTLDPDTYGGGHLLGVNAVAIVVHGSARPHGIAQACRYAAEGVERNLVGAISARVS